MAFEQFLTQKKDASRSKRWRSVTYSVSLLLHGVLLLGMVARSFWHVEELQPPAVHVTLAALHPPPPPPPPAPAPKAEAPEVKPKVAVRPRPAPQIVQPVAPTETPPAEATASNGEGEPGGVEGGVAGGVATAAPPPPPPPPKRVEPVVILLPPNVGSGQRLSDLNDPRFRPSLPPQLKRAGMIVWGLYRICVAVDGHVDNVKVIKSADNLVDDRWVALIRSWAYKPYSIEGRAVPFCHPMRIEARATL